MKKYVINGGKPLHGEVTIGGAKNAAVAIVPAVLMVDGPCVLENVPDIADVHIQFEILEKMGIRVVREDATTYRTENPGVSFDREAEYAPLMQRLRASYYFIGAMLGRYGRARVAMPGGCNFGGIRPVDQHIKGFEALGASVHMSNEFIVAHAPNGLHGANIYFDVVSVGATMNIMMAAVFAEGKTVIENAAKEPHIVDLANFLNSMGADIRHAGTDTITIRGVERLHGGTYSVVPDQIEAGTYMTAVAACGGEITIKNVIPKHLDCISAKLSEMNVTVENYDDSVIVRRDPSERIHKTNIKTLPYPGFPTDMHPQMAAVLCLADGQSRITEGVWANRFKYTDELLRFGAHVSVNGETATIFGVPELNGADVIAHDLRAGAAMIVAGLAANGTTTVSKIGFIERGYENLVEKFRGLGADISCVGEDLGELDNEA